MDLREIKVDFFLFFKNQATCFEILFLRLYKRFDMRM